MTTTGRTRSAAWKRERVVEPGIYRRNGSYRAVVWDNVLRRQVRCTFPTLSEARLWRDRLQDRVRRARGITSLTGNKHALADAYSLLRRAESALDSARPELRGQARQRAEAIQAALYQAEDELVELIRGAD